MRAMTWYAQEDSLSLRQWSSGGFLSLKSLALEVEHTQTLYQPCFQFRAVTSPYMKDNRLYCQ